MHPEWPSLTIPALWCQCDLQSETQSNPKPPRPLRLQALRSCPDTGRLCLNSLLNQTLTTRLKQGFIIKPSILKESLELIHEPFLWPFCVGCSKNQSLFSRHDLLVGWNLASCSQLQTLDNFEEIFKKPHTQKKPFLLVH